MESMSSFPLVVTDTYIGRYYFLYGRHWVLDILVSYFFPPRPCGMEVFGLHFFLLFFLYSLAEEDQDGNSDCSSLVPSEILCCKLEAHACVVNSKQPNSSRSRLHLATAGTRLYLSMHLPTYLGMLSLNLREDPVVPSCWITAHDIPPARACSPNPHCSPQRSQQPSCNVT